MDEHVANFSCGEKQFRVETGVIAKQAGGAVLVYVEGLTLLCCATATTEPREGVDFFPLMCDYEERFYAAGKFPGGFIKREGRPSEAAVLTARKIDRPIRPMFPDDFRNEVQIIVTGLSQDNVQVPDTYAITSASLALAISDIPWPKPIAAVRIGYVEGKFIVNPTFQELEQSELNLLVAGTRDRINMIEDESKEVSVDLLAEGLRLALDEIKRLVEQIEDFTRGRTKEKMAYESLPELEPELKQRVEELAQPRIETTIPAGEKEDLFSAIKTLKKEVVEQIVGDSLELDPRLVTRYIDKLVKAYARKKTMEGVRVDGRGYRDIRPITGKVDLLPRVHGSALFTRGQTQVVSSVTLGSGADRQRIDTVNYDESKRYTHHYNFPPYSVGEVRFLRGAGRREIGHGALAEKAIIPVLPPEEEFPYTLRVVSEITESNASSSMASTCGSSMALFAAGVPLRYPVGGISVGLVTEGDNHCMLVDLCGFEDFNGDMDFKVAGTEKGVTAIQLDVKIEGLTLAMTEEALNLARDGYLHVIEQMKQVIPAPREEISPYAPLLEMLQIDVDQIGLVIGPAGKNIKKICAETNAEIDIDEDGKVYVSGTDHEGVKQAVQIVRDMTSEIEMGNEYTGTVVRIMPFGAFIELVPGRDGFLHISKVAEGRIDRVEDVLSVGDKVPVRVNEVDEAGKINLIRTDITLPPARAQRGGNRPSGRRDEGRRDNYRSQRRDGNRRDSYRPQRRDDRNRDRGDRSDRGRR